MMTYEDRQLLEGKFLEYAQKISCCFHTNRLVQSVPHEVGGDSEEEKDPMKAMGVEGERVMTGFNGKIYDPPQCGLDSRIRNA